MTATGYNVGVGFEHQVGNGWSIRGDTSYERLFADAPYDMDNFFSSPPAFASISLHQGDTFFIENMRFGLSLIRRF